MSELKMPMPKLPEIQIDETMVVENPVEESIEEDDMSSMYTEDAIASVIGFVAAFGLPQPWLSRKAIEYKQAAIDVGLAHNISILLEKYFPQMEDKPEYAVLISALAFGALVISDRMSLKEKIKPKKVVVPKQKKEGDKSVQSRSNGSNNEAAEQ